MSQFCGCTLNLCNHLFSTNLFIYFIFGGNGLFFKMVEYLTFLMIFFFLKILKSFWV